MAEQSEVKKFEYDGVTDSINVTTDVEVSRQSMNWQSSCQRRFWQMGWDQFQLQMNQRKYGLV